MKKILSSDNLIFLTIFCIPLYLIKVPIFGIPSNFFEVISVAIAAIIFTQEKENILPKLLNLPKFLIISIFFIFLGLLLSTILNTENYTQSLGIIKSWFIVPIFFSLALHLKIDSSSLVEKIIRSIYFSIITVSIIAILYKIFSITTYDNRLKAFYLSPNYLSMYLAPGIFFALYFLRKSFLSNKYSRIFFINIFFLLIIVFSLYWTLSYGAWISIILSLIITSPLLISHKKILIFYASILFLVLLVFCLQKNNSKMTNLLNNYSTSSIASREIILKVSAALILKSPIAGIGPGNFQEKYLEMQKNYPPYLEWAVPQPHNIFLAFWLQAGIVGLIGFLILNYYSITNLLRCIKNKKNTALAVTLLAFFIYILIHGLIDTTYWKNDLSFIFWINIFLFLHLNKAEDHMLT